MLLGALVSGWVSEGVTSVSEAVSLSEAASVSAFGVVSLSDAAFVSV